MFSNMPVGLARFAPGVNPDADQPPMSQGFVTGPSEASGTAIGGVGSNTYTIDGATNAGINRRSPPRPTPTWFRRCASRRRTSTRRIGHGLGNSDLDDDARRHERDARHGQLSVLDEQAERAERSCRNRRSTMSRSRRSRPAARTTPRSRSAARSISRSSSTAAARRSSSRTIPT